MDSYTPLPTNDDLVPVPDDDLLPVPDDVEVYRKPTLPDVITSEEIGLVSLSKLLNGDYTQLPLNGSTVVDVIDDVNTIAGNRNGSLTLVTDVRTNGSDWDLHSFTVCIYSVTVVNDVASCVKITKSSFFIPMIEGDNTPPYSPTKSTPLVITDNLARSPLINGFVDLVPVIAELNKVYKDPSIYSGIWASLHKYGEVLRDDLHVTDYNELVKDLSVYRDAHTGFEYLQFKFKDGWTYKYRVYVETHGYLRFSRNYSEKFISKPGTLYLPDGMTKDPLYPPRITNPLVITGILLENPYGNKDAIDSLKDQFPHLILGL